MIWSLFLHTVSLRTRNITWNPHENAPQSTTMKKVLSCISRSSLPRPFPLFPLSNTSPFGPPSPLCVHSSTRLARMLSSTTDEEDRETRVIDRRKLRHALRNKMEKLKEEEDKLSSTSQFSPSSSLSSPSTRSSPLTARDREEEGIAIDRSTLLGLKHRADQAGKNKRRETFRECAVVSR